MHYRASVLDFFHISITLASQTEPRVLDLFHISIIEIKGAKIKIILFSGVSGAVVTHASSLHDQFKNFRARNRGRKISEQVIKMPNKQHLIVNKTGFHRGK